MSELRVALIAEGPTDAIVIEAGLRAVIDKPFVLKTLQPEATRPNMGTGWCGVFKWCRDFAARGYTGLENDPTLPGFDLFVLHVDADHSGGGGWRVSGWDLLAELSAVFAGIAVTAIRAARRSGYDDTPGESHWSVFVSFTLLGAMATLPPVLPPLGHWFAPTAREWLLLFFVGVTGVWAQLIMTRALKHVTATAMGIIHQVTVVLTVLGGLIFFGEMLTLRSAIGSAITVVGVLWVVYSE